MVTVRIIGRQTKGAVLLDFADGPCMIKDNGLLGIYR